MHGHTQGQGTWCERRGDNRVTITGALTYRLSPCLAARRPFVWIRPAYIIHSASLAPVYEWFGLNSRQVIDINDMPNVWLDKNSIILIQKTKIYGYLITIDCNKVNVRIYRLLVKQNRAIQFLYIIHKKKEIVRQLATHFGIRWRGIVTHHQYPHDELYYVACIIRTWPGNCEKNIKWKYFRCWYFGGYTSWRLMGYSFKNHCQHFREKLFVWE